MNKLESAEICISFPRCETQLICGLQSLTKHSLKTTYAIMEVLQRHTEMFEQVRDNSNSCQSPYVFLPITVCILKKNNRSRWAYTISWTEPQQTISSKTHSPSPKFVPVSFESTSSTESTSWNDTFKNYTQKIIWGKGIACSLILTAYSWLDSFYSFNLPSFSVYNWK